MRMILDKTFGNGFQWAEVRMGIMTDGETDFSTIDRLRDTLFEAVKHHINDAYCEFVEDLKLVSCRTFVGADGNRVHCQLTAHMVFSKAKAADGVAVTEEELHDRLQENTIEYVKSLRSVFSDERMKEILQ